MDYYEPEYVRVPKGRKGKNRRKWCKGVVGVQHVFVEKTTTFYRVTWVVKKCSNCGREKWGK